MTEREALKLALECAERCESIDGMYSWADTITAIKEALAQPEQEPVAIADGTFNHNCPIGTLLYTTPPQRTWRGLTEQEVAAIFTSVHTWHERAEAIEAKLKQKNGYDS